MCAQEAFIKTVFEEMQHREMMRGVTRVICGVSGGADSVCLLLVLLEYRRRVCPGLSLEVVHVEHGLRGEESLSDAAFVARLCREHRVPCQVVTAQVPAVAAREKCSLEEAGRLERYRIFADAAGGDETARIAVAHHMEDQAETVLFHLARGSGLTGLRGMQPVRGQIIRPLLCVTRPQIEAYLGSRGQTWREDATNTSHAYTRNRIRTQVLPLLADQVNERSVEHICSAAERVGEALNYLERAAERFCLAHVTDTKDQIRIDVDAFRAEETLLQNIILRRCIRTLRGGEGLKNLGAVHIGAMAELAWKGRGKRLDLPGGLRCRREDRQLVLFAEHMVE